MSDFKYNKKRFVECCRIYRGELSEYEEIKQKKVLSQIEQDGLMYMKQDIEYVDHLFTDIQKNIGTGCAVILWFLYIEGLTKKEISVRFKINKDKLREDICSWENEIFH